jgi:hypothetical protein
VYNYGRNLVPVSSPLLYGPSPVPSAEISFQSSRSTGTQYQRRACHARSTVKGMHWVHAVMNQSTEFCKTELTLEKIEYDIRTCHGWSSTEKACAGFMGS